MQSVSTWIAAFFTLAVFSFIYGDNPVFRFSEHLFLGIAAANLTVQGYYNVVQRAWNPLWQKGDVLSLVVIIFGVLLLCRWFKRVAWVSRIPMGFMTGVAAALSVRRSIDSEFFRQMTATARMTLLNLNDAIYVLGVVFSLAYFLYCYNTETKFGKSIRTAGLVGQYVMMIAFGASLGSTIMARLSLVIGRLNFLLQNWLGILQ